MKNIIFDIGGVLANPKSGNWFITTNFYTIVDRTLINEESLKKSLKKYLYLHTQEPKNELDEHQMFSNYYFHVLNDSNYPITESIANKIADDCVYNDDKFIFYDDVLPILDILSKKHNLYIISNGWPSSIRVLQNKKIYNYFKDIYISSMYSTIKEDTLFDIFVSEHPEVKPENSLYIDDREYVLDKVKEYNFNLLLMERETNTLESKYTKIHMLKEINNYLKLKTTHVVFILHLLIRYLLFLANY